MHFAKKVNKNFLKILIGYLDRKPICIIINPRKVKQGSTKGARLCYRAVLKRLLGAVIGYGYWIWLLRCEYMYQKGEEARL